MTFVETFTQHAKRWRNTKQNKQKQQQQQQKKKKTLPIRI